MVAWKSLAGGQAPQHLLCARSPLPQSSEIQSAQGVASRLKAPLAKKHGTVISCGGENPELDSEFYSEFDPELVDEAPGSHEVEHLSEAQYLVYRNDPLRVTPKQWET